MRIIIKGAFFITMTKQKRTLSYTESKQLKHQLLNDGTFKKYKAYRKQCYKLKPKYLIEQYNDLTGEIDKIPSFEYYHIIKQLEQQLINEISPFGFYQCQQIENNGYKRVGRLRKRIEPMIESDEDTYFTTLTFDEENLDKLDDKTKRTYVARVLKENASEYVANPDYGGTYEYIDNNGQVRTATGRIHFHAVTNKPIDKDKWPYGFSSCFKVRKDTPEEKLASLGSLPPYLDKLTKHAIKKSTKNLKPIYSRKTKREGE